MKTVCTYCGVVMKEGKPKPVSYGCCQKCLRIKGIEFGLNKDQIEGFLKQVKGV